MTHKLEYIKWANTLGGQIIDLGIGSGITFNPLQVRSFIAISEDWSRLRLILNLL
ncbi:hypothetical protein HYD96_00915 [Mycoplasmopsis bovis]|nr:hypothetical protein [Mycoplasmopsis bovis]QQH34614.1 hypothetical protein HYD96_00915 [Mycoplasmopsis bovis]